MCVCVCVLNILARHFSQTFSIEKVPGRNSSVVVFTLSQNKLVCFPYISCFFTE